jgi:hypothetical protein
MLDLIHPMTHWQAIGRYARWAPSPHNTQPFRLRVIDRERAEIVFLPRRGLWIGDPLGRFTWLTAGIFAEICSIAAHGRGLELQTSFEHAPMYRNGDFETPQTVARLHLTTPSAPVADLDADLVLKRRTSRLPYDGSSCPKEILRDLEDEAARHGHKFETRSDADAIGWVVELNKQALFNDLDDDALRTELVKWLRFDAREEDLLKDGLSARCLTFNGTLLRSFFLQHRFWTLPGVRDLVRAIYGQTMKGIGTIGWLRGPYADSEDWVVAGRTMIRLWLTLTRHGYYWHPYGSVITSENARLNMIEYLGLPGEANGEDSVWLLLRLGRSSEPPQSRRAPIEDVLLCGS